MNSFYLEIEDWILKTRPDKQELANKKIKLCKKHNMKQIPTDIQILLNAKNVQKVRKILLTKPTRSLSGVCTVAIMSMPHKCPHGKCIVCPGGLESPFGDVPQSYTGKEPATRRAIRNDYDPYLQVFNRLEQYVASGHIPEKVELIIMGGTFMSMPKQYRDNFVMNALKAMNDFSKQFFRASNLMFSRYKLFFEMPGDLGNLNREKRIKSKVLALKNKGDLATEQKKNESANIRCIGMTIETRADCAHLKDANAMLALGTTRVEIGVQSVYDASLKKMQRGHDVLETVDSIRTLKDLGFKINAHYMPGLFVSKKQDLEGLRQLFSNTDFRPDMLKIYPCMVLEGTKLHTLWKNGQYRPLTTRQASSLIADFKPYVPRYCRIMRVQRDIPSYMIKAGVDRTNLRQYVRELLKKRGTRCNCIRCREPRERLIGIPKLKILEYRASQGQEFFISIETDNALLGFCRLRFPSRQLRNEITRGSALLRELHVYGESTSLGKKGSVQHRGFGKKLLMHAENISRKHRKNKMVIISGIGVRQYYRKFGYRRQGAYMVRNI